MKPSDELKQRVYRIEKHPGMFVSDYTMQVIDTIIQFVGEYLDKIDGEKHSQPDTSGSIE